ncbi:DNA polymerase III subunit delta' [Terrihabitans sp. B22-R8]|uniref:DNA polymerase III subunit delta' n=1 Tax=Terrihabitans sp. B22-R8 TaxID=3425128 RepID=UPI00403C2B78
MADAGGDYGLESDRVDGVPHPRETYDLIGHDAAEQNLLQTYRAGRLHHALILGGPSGIGKATLAYRLARFLLAHPDSSSPAVQTANDLSVSRDHPAARRVHHLSHPDLFVLRRGLTADRKSLATEIRVEDSRRLVSFFTNTAGEGGWRIAIVDSADDLNTNSSNALLKVLEEPPPRSLFIVISSRPKQLLPTIRSRCRTLLMSPLASEQVALVLDRLETLDAVEDQNTANAAALAEGSVGKAVSMLSGNRVAVHATVTDLIVRLPQLDYSRLHALAEQTIGRDGASIFDIFIETVLDWLHARMRAGVTQGEPHLARWAELWEKTMQISRDAAIFNLDRRPLVLAIASDLAAASRG